MVVNQAQLTAIESSKVKALAGDGEQQDFTPLDLDGPTGWQQLISTRRQTIQSETETTRCDH